MSLTFKKFHEANAERAKEFFDNGNNALGHWSVATAGEGFEAIVELAKLFASLCDTTKRANNQLTDEIRVKLAKEYVDILTYLFVKSGKFEIDLESAAIDKFNEVSDRIGSKIKL